jgi:hypothetical protein
MPLESLWIVEKIRELQRWVGTFTEVKSCCDLSRRKFFKNNFIVVHSYRFDNNMRLLQKFQCCFMIMHQVSVVVNKWL